MVQALATIVTNLTNRGARVPRDVHVARGRSARAAVPRSSQALVAPQRRGRDPVALLVEEGQGRVQELLPLRYARMAVSPFTFLRGSAGVMAADLADTPTTGIETQLCG